MDSMIPSENGRPVYFALCVGVVVCICLGANLAKADVFSVYSDASDGAAYGSGAFSAQDLIVGGATGANYCGIAIFELPDLDGVAIDSAVLTLTAVTTGTMPSANADVWGLGYLTGTPAMSASWLLISDTETRDGDTLGTNLGADLPAKIVDNLVPAGTTVSSGTQTEIDVTAFVKSLYHTYGAEAGDYAVLRVNPDADQFNAEGTGANFRYGGSHRGTQASLLTITTVPEPGVVGLVLPCLVAILTMRRKK